MESPFTVEHGKQNHHAVEFIAAKELVRAITESPAGTLVINFGQGTVRITPCGRRQPDCILCDFRKNGRFSLSRRLSAPCQKRTDSAPMFTLWKVRPREAVRHLSGAIERPVCQVQSTR